MRRSGISHSPGQPSLNIPGVPAPASGNSSIPEISSESLASNGAHPWKELPAFPGTEQELLSHLQIQAGCELTASPSHLHRIPRIFPTFGITHIPRCPLPGAVNGVCASICFLRVPNFSRPRPKSIFIRPLLNTEQPLSSQNSLPRSSPRKKFHVNPRSSTFFQATFPLFPYSPPNWMSFFHKNRRHRGSALINFKFLSVFFQGVFSFSEYSQNIPVIGNAFVNFLLFPSSPDFQDKQFFPGWLPLELFCFLQSSRLFLPEF